MKFNDCSTRICTGHSHHQWVWAAAVCLLGGLVGCGEVSGPPAPARSSEEIILECVQGCGSKLDAALAEGNPEETAREIVRILDDHEDSVSGESGRAFEKFHRMMEEVEQLSAAENSEDLKAKVEEAKSLAQEFLALQVSG